MFPRAKRQRPNPPAGPDDAGLRGSAAPAPVASQASATASDVSRAPTSASSASAATASPALTTKNSASSMLPSQRGQSTISVASTTALGESPSRSIRKTRSWYGSWPRMPKPQPSTQVAHEFAVTNTLRAGHAPDFTRFTVPATTIESSDEATLSEPNIVVKSGIESAQPGLPSAPLPTTALPPSQTNQAEPEPTQGPAGKADEPEELVDAAPSSSKGPAQSSSTWLGWLPWSSASGDAVEPESTMPIGDRTKDAVAKTAGETTLRDSRPTKAAQQEPDDAVSQDINPPAQAASSWFGFWSSTNSTSSVEDKADQGREDAAQNPPPVVEEPSKPVEPTPLAAPRPAAGSTWAFWSRDTGKPESANMTNGGNQGEIAVMGAGSETKPQKADGNRLSDNNTAIREAVGKSARTSSITRVLAPKRSTRLRPGSADTDETATNRRDQSQLEPSASKAATTTTATPAAPLQRPDTPSTALPANLVMPSFNHTYRLKDNPSVIKQIAQLLLRTHQPPAKHVYLSKEHPKIRKAVAIGVHGWFPASYLRPMIGQPTGTSIRFMNHSADAIRKWAEARGCGDCEIEKIALEGDGKINDRVDNLWKLLLNWIDHIRQADLIVLACHSQGVPVGLMLVAKLIELGIVSNAKIGICAMAGVCLGPFADYKSGMGMLMGSAAELWEFGDAESEMSKRLKRALQVVLDFGGRVTFVGSIDDQVVPLDSAVYSPATHPYIFRAVFIDGQLHASDFIAHLIGFALKLRNLGISDHGLIRELSLPLAGSLYSGEGHSRLYDEQQVYDLSVVHALETSDVPLTPCHFEKRTPVSKQPNPYLLPWIMRGLLEENFVKTELSSETTELLKQFDAWEPSTKPLKDVKWRLEAVRSKL
ncbi:hypothetical protein Micbo1qcDRAFT_159497 [Microdochium bolleyi]|uniref:YMC020W-like alpha/beta hydrolase domain-containing protein n=1 Tax=Microdochium bolleyi TaxID=196109 RepID=A0A136JB56_9PEZI|nr:hypothetical protein Micbo1qcDRAFT_159497 [Microdochium bolleyi]